MTDDKPPGWAEWNKPMANQPTDRPDEPITITCDECGWKSDPFVNSTAAFEGAQEHEDVEHEGSKIKWECAH